MTSYTLEELKELNRSYQEHCGVTHLDVEMVNHFIALIEQNQKAEIPQIGDMIEYTNRTGDYYEAAHVEEIRDGLLYICEQPHVPFASSDRHLRTLRTSTSGGAWKLIPRTLKKVGEREKAFQVWGRSGPAVNSSLTFTARVSVWEYEEMALTHTTKHFDKFILNILEDNGVNKYLYVLRKGITPFKAFTTRLEYLAWMFTFKGVETPGANETTKIVWANRQAVEYLPLSEYLALQKCEVDSELINGSVQEVKRIYEERHIITYVPYQADKIELANVPPYQLAHQIMTDLMK